MPEQAKKTAQQKKASQQKELAPRPRKTASRMTAKSLQISWKKFCCVDE